MPPGLGLGGGASADPASTLFASTPLLLDTYPNAHRAYSVRKLSNDYSGYALKLRRTDNETADVNFDDNGRVSDDSIIANPSGGVSVSDLDTWVGSDDAFCTTWYDQSGEGVNATQDEAAKQPKLYSSGNLETSGSASVASLKFDGSNDNFHFNESGLTLRDITTFLCIEADSDHATAATIRCPIAFTIWYASPQTYYALLLRADPYRTVGAEYEYWYDLIATSKPAFAESTARQPHIVTLTGGSGTDKQIFYLDQTASTVKADSTATRSLLGEGTTSQKNGIGAYNDGGSPGYAWKGDIQEVIVYDSDVSANRANIEDDMNAVFGAYS